MVIVVSLYGLPTAMRMTDERAVAGFFEMDLIRRHLAHLDRNTIHPRATPPLAARPKPATPEWNRETGEPRFNGAVVKKVRIAVAGNSVKVLDVFQEEGWPSRIDDTLDPFNDQQRLDENIKRLNENLETIRFRAEVERGKGFAGSSPPGTARRKSEIPLNARNRHGTVIRQVALRLLSSVVANNTTGDTHMAIEPSTEDLISLPEAARQLPAQRAASGLTSVGIHRWTTSAAKASSWSRSNRRHALHVPGSFGALSSNG